MAEPARRSCRQRDDQDLDWDLLARLGLSRCLERARFFWQRVADRLVAARLLR